MREYKNRAEYARHQKIDLDDDFERSWGPEALSRESLRATRNARINYKGNQEHHNFLKKSKLPF